MQTVLRWMRWLDFTVALATIGWGVWKGIGEGWFASSWPLAAIGLGVGGLLLARWNPAARLQRYLHARFHRVGPLVATAPEGFPVPPGESYKPSGTGQSKFH